MPYKIEDRRSEKLKEGGRPHLFGALASGDCFMYCSEPHIKLGRDSAFNLCGRELIVLHRDEAVLGLCCDIDIVDNLT